MSIDTIFKSLYSFFENNENTLNLPIKVDFGKDVRDTLSSRWNQYCDLIEKHNFLEECIPMAKRSISLINASIDAYYCGDFISATESIVQLIDELLKRNKHLIIEDLESNYVDVEYAQWFRARVGNNYPFEKEEMSHIPANKRGKVGSNRYTTNGIPCLYIGNSVYVCWEELYRPPVDELWVSRFWPTDSLKLLNLSITGGDLIDSKYCLKYVGESEKAYKQAIIEFFSLWILQSACSVKVKEKDRAFREEYIVPQLLTQTLKKYGLDGIMYFSTSVPNVYLNNCSWISKMIAIPAFDLNKSIFSKKVESLFSMSYPINLGMLQRQLIPRQRLSESRIASNNYARKGATVWVSSRGSRYEDTLFFECENQLLQKIYWD